MTDSHEMGEAGSEGGPWVRAGSDRGGSRPLLICLLLVALAAVLPSFGELDTALISDDGAALGYVQREGAYADWFRPQYNLRTVRFWRPLVTMSLGLQEASTGVNPLPLKLFNLLGHMLAACLLAAIARRMGASLPGTLLAGLAAAFFPYQGGNVLWVVGRVDSACLPLLLAAVLLGLSDRLSWRLLGLIPAFMALATKEVAIALVPWIAILNWGRGITLRRSLMRTIPFGLLLLGVLVWRRLALGVWIGGYPTQGLRAEQSMTELLSLPSGIGAVLGLPLLFWGLGLLALFATRAIRERRILRPSLSAGLVALAGLLPLAHLLLSPEVGREHLRTFWLADCGLMLGLALLVGNRSHMGWQSDSSEPIARKGLSTVGHTLVLCVVVTFVLMRASAAQLNVSQWSRAANLAGSTVKALAGSIPSAEVRTEPLMGTQIPRTLDGAYVLQWGVADRFRAPFAKTTRPIWPWRPLFSGGAQDERTPGWPVEKNSFEPFDAAPNSPLLEVTRVPGANAGGQASALSGEDPLTFRVDGSFVLAPGQADASARLLVRATAPAQAWELVLISELGYQVATVPALGGLELEFSLRDALMSAGRVPLWMAMAQAADFGATRAYLEIRAVGAKRELLSVSKWIALEWAPELRDAIYPLEVK